MNLFDLFATLTLDTKDFERKVASAKKSMSGIADGMSNFGQGMTNVGKSISGIGQGLINFGKTASAVTAGAVAVVGAAFNKSKSFIGTYESAMTVFSRKLDGGQEAAARLYDGLVNIAKGSSFAQEHMISAGQTLVAMGLDADTTQRYVQAATDAIAGMGGSGEEVEEMATLFAKVSQQTNLYTQDIQQMVERGIPAWDILATKYHTTTDEVKDMARKGLLPAKESLDTITGALEESDEASEMFKYSMHGLASELKSGTLTGTLDSLNTSFRTFSLRLLDLDPRTESGKENIQKLNNAISKFGEVLEKVGEKFGKIVGTDLINGLDAVADWLDRFSTALDNMSPEQAEMIVHAIEAVALAGPALIIVGQALKTIGGAISGFGQLFTWLSGVVNGTSGAFSALAGVSGGVAGALGVIAAALVALTALFIVVKENWDSIVQAFTEWYEKSGMKEKLDALGAKFQELWEKLGTLHDYLVLLGTYIGVMLVPIIIALQGVISAVITWFDGLITMVTGFVDLVAGVGEIIMGILTGDQEKIKDGFNKFFTGIGEIFTGAFNMIFGMIWSFIGSVWSAIEGWLNSFGINIGNFLTNIWNTITGWCSNIFGWIGNFLNNIFRRFSEWAASIFNAVMSLLNNIIQNISTWGNNIWNAVTSTWNAARDATINIWNHITSSVGNALNNIWNTVRSKFDGVVNTIRGAMENARNTIWNIIENIKSFFSFEINWPHIPMPQFIVKPDGWQIGDLLQGSIPSLDIAWHAKGGVFTKPTLINTAGGLHGIGEAGAEAVLPITILKDYVREAMAEGVKQAQIAYKDSVNSRANVGMVNALLSGINGKEQEINVYIGGKKIASEIYDPLMDIMQRKEVFVGA